MQPGSLFCFSAVCSDFIQHLGAKFAEQQFASLFTWEMSGFDATDQVTLFLLSMMIDRIFSVTVMR